MKATVFKALVLTWAFTAWAPTVSKAGDVSCGPLTVAAARIPHFIENDQKGVFIALIRKAADIAKLDLVINVAPKKRAVQFFKNGAANALLPHSSAGEDIPSHKSIPILIKRDFAFTRQGKAIPTSVDDLEGLSVGLTFQYAYPKSITEHKNITFIRSPATDEMNLKMLSNNRFDVAIIEERSGLRALATASISNVTYDKKHPLTELFVWILFKKDECGLIHKKKMDAAFKQMKQDGSWDTIMKGPEIQSKLHS